MYILRVLHQSFKNTAIRTFVEKSLHLKNVSILILTGDSFEGRTSQAFWTLHYKINRIDLKQSIGKLQQIQWTSFCDDSRTLPLPIAKSNLYFASGIVVRTRHPSASENCHVRGRWRAKGSVANFRARSSILRTLLCLTSQPFLGSSRNAPPQCNCCVTTLRRLCRLSMRKIRDYTQSNCISYNMEKVTAARDLKILRRGRLRVLDFPNAKYFARVKQRHLAGKFDSRRHSTTSFSENVVVAGQSYEVWKFNQFATGKAG